MRRLLAAVAAVLVLSAACSEDGPISDPYHCDSGDVDGDGDGRCNE